MLRRKKQQEKERLEEAMLGKLAEDHVNRETRERLIRDYGEVEGNRRADLVELSMDPSLSWEDVQKQSEEIRHRN